MSLSPPDAAYWSQPAEALAAALGSSATGLSTARAAEALARHGENSLAGRQGAGPWRLALRQVESPLVLILIFAAAVSLAVREWTEAAIILAIVAGSTSLSFAQEFRASRALEELRGRLGLKAQVLRDGQPMALPVAEVVPGDVLMLSAGNLVPADAMVLEARDFLVSEAALTGESFPVEKRPGVVEAAAPLAGRHNLVLQGTSVRSGTARVLVVKTGRQTVFGAIAHRLGEADSETEFERGIRQFGYLLTRVMMVIVTLVLAANIALARPLVDSLLFSVALAVGLTPELLPAIVSVTMSAGARRMARRGVIVRRTAAIENLGSVDILCTDKTGTLTRGVVELSRATLPDGQDSTEVFAAALINAQLETGIQNPLDEAIIATAKARGVTLPDVTKVDEIPYDFLRKRLTIVIEEAGAPDHRILTKGAFDAVLSCCSQISTPTGPRALDAAARESLTAYYAARGAEGFRVLGLASRRMAPRSRYEAADEAEMVFEGFLLFFDPLKEGIVETMAALGTLGIAVKVITGDNRHVAAHIGAAAGLGGRVLSGAELAETSQEALWHLAEATDIFAEIDPQQKERVVRALQKRGHVVAYLGDGINDAPALKAADVGISVDQAVDVARESADIVMLERDLDVLRQGVVDGRRTFANTLKYISITTSANFGNMISMAIGTLFLPFLPLLASQILLNNFLSDFPSVAIATDRVDPETVARAPRWDLPRIRSYMVVFGLVSTLFDLVTFGLLLWVFQAGEAEFQTAWFLISLLTELAVVLVLRSRRPAWTSRPGGLLLGASVAVSALALGLPYLGPLSQGLGLVALPGRLVVVALAIVAAYVAASEATKFVYYRLQSRAARP